MSELNDAIDHVKTWLRCSPICDNEPSLLARRIAMVIEAAERCAVVAEQNGHQPEPDTSLAASIEFCQKMAGSVTEKRHIANIIEAARKWDEWRPIIEPQTFAEHVEEINELGLGYHGPKEKQK